MDVSTEGVVSGLPPDLVAFHLGFVVRDLEAVADRYRRMLGVDHWRVREIGWAKVPWDDRTTDARLRIALGRGADQTIELLQVLEGRTQHSEFLEAHGEGVQHIGFWVPDVRAAVRSMVALGATVTYAVLDRKHNAAVELTSGSGREEILKAIGVEGVAVVDPELGAVQFEFVGPSIAPRLREWLKEDFDAMLVPPPWETQS